MSSHLFSSMQSLLSACRCLEEGRRNVPLPAEILAPRRRRKRRMSTLEDSVKALPNICHTCCFRLLHVGASMIFCTGGVCVSRSLEKKSFFTTSRVSSMFMKHHPPSMHIYSGLPSKTHVKMYICFLKCFPMEACFCHVMNK